MTRLSQNQDTTEKVLYTCRHVMQGRAGTVEILLDRHADRPYVVRITPLYQAGTVHSFHDQVEAREFADSVDIADYRKDN